MPEFKIESKFKPTGHQPGAIDKLVDGLNAGNREQTLLGSPAAARPSRSPTLSSGYRDPPW